MERKEVYINGISTTTSYDEGDCIELVNLRKKNGAMHPVSPRKVVREFTQKYTYLFVHKNNNYEHLIGVRNGNLYWVKDDDTEVLLMAIKGDVTLTQVGNILNVLDDNGLNYALWNVDKYKSIPSLSDSNLPIAHIRAQGSNKYNGTNEIHDLGVEATDDMASGIVKKHISKLKTEGRLFGCVLCCYAYEMFDGSFVYHSNPQFLGQAWDEHTRLESININDKTYSYKDVTYFTTPLVSGIYTLATISSGNVPENLEDKTNSVILKDIRPNLSIYHSFSKGLSPIYWTSFLTSYNELQINIQTAIPAEYSELIRSISIFITPEVYMYDFENISSYWVQKNNTNGVKMFKAKDRSIEDVMNELMSHENFYKVHEIPFEQINTNINNWITIDLKGKLGDDLLIQPELLSDSATRNPIIAKKQFMYNGRLHIFDYTTSVFKGYSLEAYFAQRGLGQFQPSNQVSQGQGIIWWIEVYLKIGNGTSKVVQKKPYMGTQPFSIYDFMPLLSYPDRRAYKMRIYVAVAYNPPTYGYDNTFEFELIPHKNQNFAYYLSPDLKPIKLISALTSTSTPQVDTATIPSDLNVIERFPNVIKASQINNPIYFNPKNTYTISTGQILNAASNAMNVSDRNFGSYPVFVATTEGWFMLQVGDPENDIAYTKISPITSGEVPLSSVLCSTPVGVVFGGKRGLFLINSNGTTLLTPQIEQEQQALTIEWHAVLDNVIRRTDTNYSEYIANLTNILYDAGENEIIIINNAYNYNLVLNLEAKSIHKTTEKIDYEVKNTYPELLIADGQNLKDISKSDETKKTHVSFMLRPLAFGTRDIKKLDRVYLRALLRNLSHVSEKNPAVVLHHSNDNVNFNITRGIQLRPGNLRDVDMGLFARMKYKWFLLGFGGEVDEDSVLISIEANVGQEYENEKMR